MVDFTQLNIATSSSVCAWQSSGISRGPYHKQVAKFETKEDKLCVWPKSPCKGQNWENTWTDPCASTLLFSGVQMLFKDITETVSPKVLRTIQNLGVSNLICFAFKRKKPCCKGYKPKGSLALLLEKKCSGLLSFPFICVNSETIIRRIISE